MRATCHAKHVSTWRAVRSDIVLAYTSLAPPRPTRERSVRIHTSCVCHRLNRHPSFVLEFDPPKTNDIMLRLQGIMLSGCLLARLPMHALGRGAFLERSPSTFARTESQCVGDNASAGKYRLCADSGIRADLRIAAQVQMQGAFFGMSARSSRAGRACGSRVGMRLVALCCWRPMRHQPQGSTRMSMRCFFIDSNPASAWDVILAPLLLALRKKWNESSSYAPPGDVQRSLDPSHGF